MKAEWKKHWPKLDPHHARLESPATPDYNCLAFAAGRSDEWWEPYVIPPEMPGYYWPKNVHPDNTPEDWAAALATLGFERCNDALLEPEFVKVALYATPREVTHAARQLRDGRWASKLGKWEDIIHDDLAVLEGPLYGTICMVLKRPRRDGDP